jgi:hypothetical protein
MNRPKSAVLPAILLAICVVTGSTRAASISIDALQDITLDRNSGNQNTRNHLLVGTNGNAGPYTTFVAFDFSAITLNPGESIEVNGATIDFCQNDVNGGVGGGSAFTILVNQ